MILLSNAESQFRHVLEKIHPLVVVCLVLVLDGGLEMFCAEEGDISLRHRYLNVVAMKDGRYCLRLHRNTKAGYKYLLISIYLLLAYVVIFVEQSLYVGLDFFDRRKR